jgi:hypothetical protein
MSLGDSRHSALSSFATTDHLKTWCRHTAAASSPRIGDPIAPGRSRHSPFEAGRAGVEEIEPQLERSGDQRSAFAHLDRIAETAALAGIDFRLRSHCARINRPVGSSSGKPRENTRGKSSPLFD